MTDYDVVIVGGGHNGLVASFYLARAGLRVAVFERREEVGGAAYTEELFPGGFKTYRRAWTEAQAGRNPEQPVCHIQVPTAYDSTLTDRDGEIVSIWTLYAPPRPATGTWDSRRAETAERLINYVNGGPAGSS
jgi:phytoene dehydrogenase-like protein